MQDQHSRTYRFSLSRLLVAVFIAGIAFAILSQYLLFKKRVALQEAEIRELGGFIEKYSAIGAPEWLRFEPLPLQP